MAPGREQSGSGCRWSIPGAGESQGNRRRKGKGSPVPEREPRSQTAPGEVPVGPWGKGNWR